MADEQDISIQTEAAAETRTDKPERTERTERTGSRGGRRGRRSPESAESIEGQDKEKELIEKVVAVNRTAKVVKGGRRFHFSALIVVGDRKGRVGVGLGKGTEVADAIRKGTEGARANMVRVALKGPTLPHEVTSEFCGARVLLRPASPGTGIIAGKTVRAVLESAGVKDVLSKLIGSRNPANVVKAVMNALGQLRLQEDIYKIRGLELPQPTPPPILPAEAPAPAAPAVS